MAHDRHPPPHPRCDTLEIHQFTQNTTAPLRVCFQLRKTARRKFSNKILLHTQPGAAHIIVYMLNDLLADNCFLQKLT